MKKGKIITYSIVIALFLIFAVVGVVSLFMNNNVKNTTTFTVAIDNAYCQIDAKYYINGEEKTECAYSQKYDDIVEYSKDGGTLRGWTELDSLSAFNKDINSDQSFRYEITITNLNAEMPLYINLTKVAVGIKTIGTEQIRCFYTKVTFNSDVMFDDLNNNTATATVTGQTLAINEAQISAKGTENDVLQIVIEITKPQNIVEDFEIKNDFDISISTSPKQ